MYPPRSNHNIRSSPLNDRCTNVSHRSLLKPYKTNMDYQGPVTRYDRFLHGLLTNFSLLFRRALHHDFRPSYWSLAGIVYHQISRCQFQCFRIECYIPVTFKDWLFELLREREPTLSPVRSDTDSQHDVQPFTNEYHAALYSLE